MKQLARLTVSALLMVIGQLTIFGAPAFGQATGKVVLYASVGPELRIYDVDSKSGALVKRGSLSVPANIQEAAVHPSKRYLYVAWSDGGPGATGGAHGLSAFRINAATGDLQAHGAPVALPARPIHISTDVSGEDVLVAYNEPSRLTVHRIASDGAVGPLVQPAHPLDLGIYAHQVRVDSSNKTVIVPARGNAATAQKPEEPGSIRVFNYKDGVLSNRGFVAPNGGFGFSPRHLEFDPSGKWMFLTLERENTLHVYGRRNDGSLTPAPLFIKDTLAEPKNVRPGQAAGSIHIHPNGRFIYTSNRANGTTNFEGKPVFVGGENTVAVFSINSATGEPTLIQNIDTRGKRPRTFSLDEAGSILIVGNQMAMPVREGAGVATVPASLAVFRIRTDGQLEFLSKTDVPETTATRELLWVRVVSLP